MPDQQTADSSHRRRPWWRADLDDRTGWPGLRPAVRRAGLGDTLAGAQRSLSAKGIDPATDEGPTQLRNNTQQLENDRADPNGRLRTFITHTPDGGLRSDLVALRTGASDLYAGAHNAAPLAASAWPARRDRQCSLERLYPPIEV